MEVSESQQPTAISLFSGCGGLDIGAHLAGVQSVACIENDPAAASTLRRNSDRYPTSPQFSDPCFSLEVIEKDIRKTTVNGDIIPAIANVLDNERVDSEDVDLVIGGPPCQSFSRSNEGNRRGTNSELGQLYEAYENILAKLNPGGFVFENVVGLLSSNNGNDIKAIRAALSDPTDETGKAATRGYNIEVLKLDASEYGVPQSRERVFILGVRDDLGTAPDREAIQDIHHPQGWQTAGDALEPFDIDANLDEYQNAIRSKYAGFLSGIPEGANYQHFSDRRYEDGEYVERNSDELAEKEWDWRSRHWNYLLKLDPNQPAWTLQAQPGSIVGPFHWQSRPLSFIEQLRLMTIPVWYEISGSPTDIQRQIGNAVPPYLACAVIGALTDAIGLDRTSHELQSPEPGVVVGPEDNDQLLTREVSGSPWAALPNLVTQLQDTGSIKLTAERERISHLIDILELLRYHVRNFDVLDIETQTGSQPDPDSSRTYRPDTPSPSILNAWVSLSDAQHAKRSLNATEVPATTD